MIRDTAAGGGNLDRVNAAIFDAHRRDSDGCIGLPDEHFAVAFPYERQAAPGCDGAERHAFTHAAGCVGERRCAHLIGNDQLRAVCNAVARTINLDGVQSGDRHHGGQHERAVRFIHQQRTVSVPKEGEWAGAIGKGGEDGRVARAMHLVRQGRGRGGGIETQRRGVRHGVARAGNFHAVNAKRSIRGRGNDQRVIRFACHQHVIVTPLEGERSRAVRHS